MLKVNAIHAFSDNYIWCVIDDHQKHAVVIDPGCSKSVLNFLAKKDLKLTGILITHHHPDHIGGVDDLKQRTGAKVYGFSNAGPKNAKLSFIDNAYNQGDSFFILGTQFQVLEVPGHTLDHIAFYSESDQSHKKPWLFCGDTLFSGGCGRLFEGTAAQMHHSLQKFSNLPHECEVYCAHEYTLANLEFALSLMPSNTALRLYADECKTKRNNNEITLPSTIGTELEINPFLRMQDTELVLSLQDVNKSLSASEEDIFAATRKAKDIF